MRLTRIWFDRPGVRWPRVLAVAAVATAGVALWLVKDRGLWDDAPPVTVAEAPHEPASAPAALRTPARRDGRGAGPGGQRLGGSGCGRRDARLRAGQRARGPRRTRRRPRAACAMSARVP